MKAGDYSLNQYNTVEYLRCYLDSDLNKETMARRVLKKINTKPNLLQRQRNYFAIYSANIIRDQKMYSLLQTVARKVD